MYSSYFIQCAVCIVSLRQVLRTYVKKVFIHHARTIFKLYRKLFFKLFIEGYTKDEFTCSISVKKIGK